MPLYRRTEDIPEADLAAEMKVLPPSSEEGTTWKVLMIVF